MLISGCAGQLLVRLICGDPDKTRWFNRPPEFIHYWRNISSLNQYLFLSCDAVNQSKMFPTEIMANISASFLKYCNDQWNFVRLWSSKCKTSHAKSQQQCLFSEMETQSLKIIYAAASSLGWNFCPTILNHYTVGACKGSMKNHNGVSASIHASLISALWYTTKNS